MRVVHIPQPEGASGELADLARLLWVHWNQLQTGTLGASMRFRRHDMHMKNGLFAFGAVVALLFSGIAPVGASPAGSGLSGLKKATPGQTENVCWRRGYRGYRAEGAGVVVGVGHRHHHWRHWR